MKKPSRCGIDIAGRANRPATLYNIMLPIWLILFWPSYLWLILIPVNYLLDRIVLRWSLGELPDKGLFCRKHTWKICLAGFLSDFLGFLFLFASFMLSAWISSDTPFGDFAEKIGYGVGFNPFSNFWAFLIVTASVLIAGVLIFLLDRAILHKAGLDPEQAKKSALRLALLTAPYLYFIPSYFLYESGFYA